MVLDNKVQFTAVIARGDLKFNPLRFEANEVYAGSSVPGGDLDVVRGTVTSRTVDDKIIVQGATLFRTDGTIVFNDYVTIQLDASTTVAKQLEVGNFTIDDISVGQRISVFGMITNDQISDLQMSAVNGFARMRISSVNGEVISLPDELNYLSLNLNSINGRNISIYDFTGTGIDAGNDADPAQYEVDTGSLSLANITVDDPVIVRGFPTAFATAPADFTARTVMTSE
jgi:restriction endonuclease S subunit